MWNDNSHLHEIPISWRHLQYFNPNKLFDGSLRVRRSATCFRSKIVVRVQPRSSKGITDLFSPYSSLRLQAYWQNTTSRFQFSIQSLLRILISLLLPCSSESKYVECWYSSRWKDTFWTLIVLLFHPFSLIFDVFSIKWNNTFRF